MVQNCLYRKIDLSQFQTRPSKPDPNKKKQRKRINNGLAPTQGQNQQGQGGNNNQQGGDKKPLTEIITIVRTKVVETTTKVVQTETDLIALIIKAAVIKAEKSNACRTF